MKLLEVFSGFYHSTCMFNSLFLFFVKDLFIYLFMIDREGEREKGRERERQRHRRREKQALYREPDVGLDPGTPESYPGPKAGVKLLSHPGIPCLILYYRDSS